MSEMILSEYYYYFFSFFFCSFSNINYFFFFFFSSRRRHTRSLRDWSSDVCSSDLPWQREADLLTSVPGFGDVVAQAWLGEIGPAPHLHFASREKLASWVSLCPGNNISARKRKYGRTGDAGTYIKPMLIQAAWAAIRVRGRLQARYNRLARRYGGDKNPGAKKKAITAIAHTLLKRSEERRV